MNPTIIGMFAVLVWGFAVPIVRIIQDHTSIWIYTGVVYTLLGLYGIALNRYKKIRSNPAIFRNPATYARWFFFCFHTICFLMAVSMVQKQYLPLVILINYLWPTAVILYSVLLRVVPVTRWPFFV